MTDPSPAPGTPLSDLFAIVGGSFTPASLGPEQYEEIRARARANAPAYLDLFEALFLGERFDAMGQSSIDLPGFLALVAEGEPQRAHDLAGRLLRQYDAVLAFYDAAHDRDALLELMPSETRRMALRMEDRRAALKRVLGMEEG
jgi:hypothetical protein